MKKILVISIIFTSFSAFAHKCDSVGTSTKNGNIYVLHKVDKGDGLYSLSKKYNVSLKSILDENPGADASIKIDQILLIPTRNLASETTKPIKDITKKSDVITESKEKVAPKSASEAKENNSLKRHKVEAGQTLYTISKIYNTSVESIKKSNSLESDVLSEGQVLMVPEGIDKKEDTEIKDKKEKKEKVEKESDKLKSEDSDKVQSKDKYKQVGFDTEVTTKTVESSSGYSIKVEKLVEYNIEKVEETGTVTIGADKIPNDKNFALHFNAPIGTVIMVTNPANKNTIFVKVIGNFAKPDNSSEIIRMSSQSAEQIGIKSKDKVAVSYAR